MIAFWSTAVGILAVLVLNLVTPLAALNIKVAIWMGLSQRELVDGLLLRLLGWVLVCLIPVFTMRLVLLRPVAGCLARIRAGQDPPPELWEQARRRIINLPFIYGLINVAMWLVIPLLLGLIFYWMGQMGEQLMLFLSTRSAMVGLINSAIAFLFLERHAREVLIPFFFPRGHLAKVKGTARLSLSRRIKLLYLAGTLVPSIFFLFTLFSLQYEASGNAVSAAEYGRGVLIFSLVLGAMALALGLRLNHLVTSALAGPLRQMLEVVSQVQKGDYSGRIQVVSNDEIGVLGDAGNQMIRGLKEREVLRSEFGKYVTPEIRDEILAGRIPLEGERRDATVLFTDLRDFTPFVENNPPEVVIASMRAYFTAMHQVIRAHRGVVLQFVGDEIEAAFGVPLPFADHADQAMRAALAMRKALEELNQKRRAKGLHTFTHGVGLHSGLVLAGNTGSEKQHAYALIGDTVNVASRIQDLTKDIGWDILASRETMGRLSFSCPAEEVGPRAIKGYSKPVVIFKVLG